MILVPKNRVPRGHTEPSFMYQIKNKSKVIYLLAREIRIGNKWSLALSWPTGEAVELLSTLDMSQFGKIIWILFRIPMEDH